MYNRNKFRKEIEHKENKSEEAKQLWEQKNKRLSQLHKELQDNFQNYATQYQEKIRKNPWFRSQFNELCQEIGVDPMISKKTFFSDLGFGNFYSELTTKILDLTNKKRKQNGGIMKLDDVILDFKNRYKEVITKEDIKMSIKTIQEFGGVQILNDEYLCTVPLEFSNDISEAMALGEENGFINYTICKNQKGWEFNRFEQVVQGLQKEGLLWVDEKTVNKEHNYYFPSMINHYMTNKPRFIQKHGQY